MNMFSPTQWRAKGRNKGGVNRAPIRWVRSFFLKIPFPICFKRICLYFDRYLFNLMRFTLEAFTGGRSLRPFEFQGFPNSLVEHDVNRRSEDNLCFEALSLFRVHVNFEGVHCVFPKTQHFKNLSLFTLDMLYNQIITKLRHLTMEPA